MKVDFDGDVLKQLQRLPRPAFAAALRAILGLVDDPRPPGAASLVSVPGGLRIRFGDYRLLYLVDDAAQTVTVYRVGHRRDVYEA